MGSVGARVGVERDGERVGVADDGAAEGPAENVGGVGASVSVAVGAGVGDVDGLRDGSAVVGLDVLGARVGCAVGTKAPPTQAHSKPRLTAQLSASGAARKGRVEPARPCTALPDALV